jgi:DNA-binding Xre family transcriptional regulator
MRMRLRLPELLEERKPPLTAYALAKASNGRISMSTAYRLTKLRGQVATFDRDVLIALCDALHVGPDQLFSRDDEAPPPKAKPRKAAK